MVHQGLAAIENAVVDRPDVIVLDIGLPDIDGYEVAKRLRQRPGIEQVLLVALTGYGQEEDRQRCYDAGFDEHFVKPVDPASLEAFFWSWFERHRTVTGSNS
jgi:CheY-like chemotaxis protein